MNLYAEYKHKYCMLKQTAGVLSAEGNDVMSQWTREWKSPGSTFSTDFNPGHYEHFWTGLRERLQMSSVAYDSAPAVNPVGKTLNVLFISTGFKPYPEILTLHHLQNEGYVIGNVFFFDKVYQDSDRVDMTKRIINESLNPPPTDTFFRYDPPAMIRAIGADKIDIVVGFNIQFAYSFPAGITAHTMLERELINKEELNALYLHILGGNPSVISTSIVSRDNGEYDSSFDFLQGSLTKGIDRAERLLPFRKP